MAQEEQIQSKRFPMQGGPDLILAACPFSLEATSVEALHPNEILKLKDISNEKRRNEWISGRLLLKRALMEFWGEAREGRSIEIAAGFNRQPWIATPVPFSTSVSLTHTQGFALAAVTCASHPVGIDVESITTRRVEALSRDTELREVGLLLGSSLEEQALRLTAAWTAKEALSKIFGCGLGISFRALSLRDFKFTEHGFEGGYQQVSAYRWMSAKKGGQLVSLAYPTEHPISKGDFEQWILSLNGGSL